MGWHNIDHLPHRSTLPAAFIYSTLDHHRLALPICNLMQVFQFFDNQKMTLTVDDALAFHLGQAGAHALATGAHHVRDVLLGEGNTDLDVSPGQLAVVCTQPDQELRDFHLDIAIREA